MFINKRTILCLILTGCCLYLVSCSPKKEALPVSSEKISAPYQEFDHSVLSFFSKQYIQWKLEAEHMRKPLSDTGSILVVPVRLAIYDSVGRIRTKVFADSGTTTTSMEKFVVWGDVLIKAKRDSMTIRSQRIWWNKTTHTVESNTYVQIETIKGDILRGKGLNAIEDFSKFSFLSDVKGKFPDFKRRLESKDEKFF